MKCLYSFRSHQIFASCRLSMAPPAPSLWVFRQSRFSRLTSLALLSSWPTVTSWHSRSHSGYSSHLVWANQVASSWLLESSSWLLQPLLLGYPSHLLATGITFWPLGLATGESPHFYLFLLLAAARLTVFFLVTQPGLTIGSRAFSQPICCPSYRVLF